MCACMCAGKFVPLGAFVCEDVCMNVDMDAYVRL